MAHMADRQVVKAPHSQAARRREQERYMAAYLLFERFGQGGEMACGSRYTSTSPEGPGAAIYAVSKRFGAGHNEE